MAGEAGKRVKTLASRQSELFFRKLFRTLWTISDTDIMIRKSRSQTTQGDRTMKTITIRGDVYPAIEAAKLENGMIRYDGFEIANVQVSGKTVKFTLTLGSLTVARTVRTTSLIALSEEQVAVFI